MNLKSKKFTMKTKFIKIVNKIKSLQIKIHLQKIIILFPKNKSIYKIYIQMSLKCFICLKYFKSLQIVIKLITCH